MRPSKMLGSQRCFRTCTNRSDLLRLSSKRFEGDQPDNSAAKAVRTTLHCEKGIPDPSQDLRCELERRFAVDSRELTGGTGVSLLLERYWEVKGCKLSQVPKAKPAIASIGSQS